MARIPPATLIGGCPGVHDMFYIYKKIIFHFFIFIVSVGYFVTAINLGNPIADGRLQPSFFPMIVGSFAVLFSGILLFKEWTLVKRNVADTSNENSPYAAPIIIFCIFIYIIAFSAIGYFIPSTLFVFSMMLMFSSKEKLIQKAVISIVIVTLGYFIFELLFGVRLPTLGGGN
ncbi:MULTISPECIES: tripartite tricarboxylate transporter TctB family protein [Marinobacter]|uniref:tripartite tricarboxylate transporter TctB family protein n=1 Tax=Marinobacter TaxID=2742 RepID=UPI0029433F98|nr:tripartite tricarboxylate transporter TctB family protein [Marinobacter salarius]WOI19856.1 tripartite tricarboxylate transporter TctB family protein [Marinobacter salarius]